MNKDLTGLTLKPSYDTEQDNIVQDLYAPCLAKSVSYDRAVGYFRANIYRELGEPLLNFVIAGGKVRIVCSPDIPAEDEEAARQGYSLRGTRMGQDRETDLVATLDAMSEDPDEVDCLNMLRLLVEHGSLDLYIATRQGGIYHRKVGRFLDALGNSIVFSGSGNETFPALTTVEDWSNDEEFDVFRSWDPSHEGERARSKSSYLDRLFAGGTARTRVRQLDKVERAVLDRFRAFSALESCRAGAKQRSAAPTPPTKEPTPKPIQPYFYQEEAIAKWNAAGRVGLLSMATGTGKTITALLALKPVLDAGAPVLIVVPSKALLEQWHSNIRAFYPSIPVLRAGAGWDWKSDSSKRLYVSGLAQRRIILATMRTASTDDFLDFIGQAEGATLVADEAHRLGSENNRRLLETPFMCRLGLSATPERLFDPVGEQALKVAFGEQPVFELPINGKVRLSESDTKVVPILGRFLSRYRYGFKTLLLTATEQQEWDRLAVEARGLMARQKGKPFATLLQNPRIKFILIRRAKIVKKAAGKLDVARRVIKEMYPDDGRWIVYCEDEEQLNDVLARLRSDNPSQAILPYHSRMSTDERAATLDHFARNPSIIVSIRCLDEGVDLPAADGGLILASSSNPREYVQRRGRLLRTAVGKERAEIVDAIVLPRQSAQEEDFPASIVRSEIARAYVFAGDAENAEITHDLWKLCREYGVDPKHDAYLDLDLQGEAET